MNTASISVGRSQAIPKLRWLRIVPPILITCIISYMDRVNIAFAMPGGMDEELGITASMAGLAGGILGRDADLVVMVDCQIPADDLVVHFF